MTSQINKILKDIENLKIKDNTDDIYSLSNILKAILKKQNFKYENLYKIYHKIHSNLYEECQICKTRKKIAEDYFNEYGSIIKRLDENMVIEEWEKTDHCIVCQNHFDTMQMCYSCGDVICGKCCPFDLKWHI
ncbi:MAG: hypothetical protein SPLM_01840 [Spiroplasma phoeniceum]|uniref:hypothetical protein n=1 Tax=Spiroplasma phoeniceum TaxID=47835 RepID=UPI0032886405